MARKTSLVHDCGGKVVRLSGEVPLVFLGEAVPELQASFHQTLVHPAARPRQRGEERLSRPKGNTETNETTVIVESVFLVGTGLSHIYIHNRVEASYLKGGGEEVVA